MKQQVLKFFANLLAKIKQPLLPHINVYRPVHVSIKYVMVYMYIDYMYTAGHVLLELCDQSDGNCTRQSSGISQKKLGNCAALTKNYVAL